MKEIKCPKCGTVITVDDADFAALLSQVRTEEFNAELRRQVDEAKELQRAHEAAKAAQEAARHKEELSAKDARISELTQKIKDWEESKKLEVEAATLKAEQKAAKMTMEGGYLD